MLSSELIKKIRQIEIRTRHLVSDSFAGDYHSVFKGQGLSFSEVRPYQPGDEIRMIDWNVTARMGEPFIKRFVEERELTVMLLVDASGSKDFGSMRMLKRELAAELTAVFSFSATSNNDKVGLMIFTDQVELFIPPRKGRKHVLRMIRELLAFEPKGRGTDIKLALDTINRLLHRRGIIFLLSDFIAKQEGYDRVLGVTAQRHDLVAIELSDPLETVIPAVGLLLLQDQESGEQQLVDTTDPQWRAAVKESREKEQLSLQQLFRRHQIDHVQLSTAEEYVGALTRFFHKRARRLRR